MLIKIIRIQLPFQYTYKWNTKYSHHTTLLTLAFHTFYALHLAFVSRPAPTCCFLQFSHFVVQKMHPHKLPSNLYKSGRKSKCMFWEYDKQLWARNTTALCKKFNHHFDGQKTPSISLGRNQSCHKDLRQSIPLLSGQILYSSFSQQNPILVNTHTREKTAWRIT